MLALLHGYVGDPEAWDDVAADLGEARAVALPGHGGGPVRDTWHDNIAAVARAIGGCEVVVGYSLGARVALGLLAAGAIERAILVGVNPGLPEDERAARRTNDASWVRLLRDRGLVAFLDAWEAQPLFASQARVAPARLAARRARRMRLDPEQLARSLEVMGLAEMPDHRAVVDDRCALVCGSEDARFIAIAGALGRPVELIAGAGHDVPLEQPAALAAAISRLEQRT